MWLHALCNSVTLNYNITTSITFFSNRSNGAMEHSLLGLILLQLSPAVCDFSLIMITILLSGKLNKRKPIDLRGCYSLEIKKKGTFYDHHKKWGENQFTINSSKGLLVLESGQHPCFDIWLPKRLLYKNWISKYI